MRRIGGDAIDARVNDLEIELTCDGFLWRHAAGSELAKVVDALVK